MNKKVVFASLTAAAAGAAAILLLSKKEHRSAAVKTADEPAAGKSAKIYAFGTYSFVSGFKDAATVEVKIPYNAERFTFDVVEEEFLCPTSDSHAAILSGEDIDAQIEYAPFYAGDDFDKLRSGAKNNAGYAEFSNSFCYVRGDSIYYCLPVDDYTYLLITVMLASDSELKFEELPNAPELKELIGGITINITK